MAKFLLQHPDIYRVRAVTRNPDSDAARILQTKGAEVVQADLTVPETLAAAVKGCWGAFDVTNFYDDGLFVFDSSISHERTNAFIGGKGGGHAN